MISVVIPCHNAAATLDETLASLVAQVDAPPFEVIVVDNRSTDGTAEVAQRWAGRLPLRVVGAPDRPSAAHARNVGAAHARFELLAFLDADDIAGPGWMAALTAALGHADLVTGPSEPFGAPEGLVEARIDRGGPRWLRNPPFLPYAQSNNLAVRRETFDAVGGFDEGFLGSGGEDCAFSWSAQLAGARFAVAPGMVVGYRQRLDRRAMRRQVRAYAAAQALLHRRFRRFGHPRPSLAASLARWGWLAVHLPRAFDRGPQGDRWWTVCEGRVGRVLGSLRHRVWYP